MFFRRQAATYVDESFTVIESELLKGYESTRSGCGNKCAQCQQGRAQEEKFVFTDGDFIIAGRRPATVVCPKVTYTAPHYRRWDEISGDVIISSRPAVIYIPQLQYVALCKFVAQNVLFCLMVSVVPIATLE